MATVPYDPATWCGSGWPSSTTEGSKVPTGKAVDTERSTARERDSGDRSSLGKSKNIVTEQGVRNGQARVLHRIRAVRLRQGVSLRTVARRTGVPVRVLREQERDSTDLRLSDLYRWQRVLDVPVEELLDESDSPLSRPVLERALLVRIMKTALSLQESVPRGSLKCLADRLVAQLVELMPELAQVSAWPSLGQQRTLDELGRIVQNPVSEEWLRHPCREDD